MRPGGPPSGIFSGEELLAVHPLWRAVLHRGRINPRPWLVVLVASLGLLMVTPVLLGSSAGGQSAATEAGSGIARLSPDLRQLPDLTSKILIIVVQLALVLAAAKLLGWAAESVRIPGVLGELAAGMLIGPFALGSIIPVYTHHGWLPLFPRPGMVAGLPEWPISQTLWAVAVAASIVLLFVAGLHTNLQQFLRNLAPASICAVGGVIAPFFLGTWTATLFVKDAAGNAVGMWSVPALFTGAIMVATSVGITARVLSDVGKLETPEGVTILGGAVVDDVLGILVLAIVVGIERSGAVSAASVLVTTVKAVGVWLGITGLSLLLAGWIERAFERVRYSGARVGLGLALAFFCAGLAEMFGLAFIIGAYSVGLGLSRTKMAQQLVEDLQAVYDFIVPVFFAAMGMLVNYSAMAVAVAFGIVLSLWAIVSKIFGCGLPALMWFNLRGAARIGMGMLPRGEVALIVAGVGLAERAIDQSIFGVSIMMTLITTIIAPLALVPLFRGAPGRRGEVAPERPPEEPISIEMPRSVSTNFVHLLLVVFQERGFELRYGDPDEGIYQLERGDLAASIRDHDGRVIVQVSAKGHACVEQIVQEAEARLIEAVRQIHEIPPPGNGAPSEPNPTASGRR